MLTRLRNGILRAQDLRESGAASPTQRPSMACELVELSAKCATWRVPVPNQADCYLKAEPGGPERFVVHIDAETFYRRWLETSPTFPKQNSQDCVPRRAMSLDSKFAVAATAFRGGRDAPVTLPSVGYWAAASGYEVAMSDGMTRTFWLLAHRVRSFPVSVADASWATILNGMAGIGVAPIAFSELFARRA
ncbi:plasmid fertility inhibition factor family protein [Burkholderia cenocepacia]|uniref:plasmid fertility inhibition factor family protein n=1 Tax=Burkholderia cenocepacia TaxID=95486 RepID=UPI001B9CF628|nr:Osa protein [Burkholderia cenocepacia]MBR8135915.1 Osa protein [Burkholderia cenocepacia]